MRQHHRDSDQAKPFHGDAGKGGRSELEETVGCDEDTPYEHDRSNGDRQQQSPAGPGADAVTVQQDHVAAERLSEQQQRDGDAEHPDEAVQLPGYSDGERDPLNGGHDLAPESGGSGAASHGISQPPSSRT